jgi:outer membrane protein
MRAKQWIVTLGAVGVLAFGLGAKNDEAFKMGIVDLDQAVSSTKEGKAAREEIERKRRDAEAVLQPMIDEFQTKAKDFESQQFVLSDDARRKRELDLQERRMRIEGKQKELQGELEISVERLIGPLRAKMDEIVSDVGKEGGFSLIIRRNTPGLMYSREALDMTDLVISKFNEKG